MHKLLLRQVRRHFGSEDAVPGEVRAFLAAVEATYEQSDADRMMLDHSMNTVSQEMLERNRRLGDALQERARHEQDLGVALGMVRGTIESTADGILVMDDHGRIKLTNERLAEMWSIPAELIASGDTAGALARAVEQVTDSAGFLEMVRAVYADREMTSSGEIEFKDGRVFERYSKSLKVGGVHAGRVWSFRDVTGLRALQQQLLQSQKMEAVGQLAGGVAHDFNNLLTIIGMHSEFLAADLVDADPRRADVDAIVAAADRAAALTRQLLAFSRKQLLKPVALDLNSVVAGVEPMLRRLIGEDIAVTTVCHDDAGVVLADPRQLEQVLVNLVVNARDAMPRGGAITISTARGELDIADLRAGKVMPADASCAVLTVSDTGCGMTASVRNRIFEPFYTTKEPGKGTGLGLSTVYGVIKQSGGEIVVYSEPGRGTMFKLYLPIVAGAAAIACAPAGVAMAGHETILLVEDEEPLRAAAQRSLEHCGYTVISASNGEEARLIAADWKTPIDLLVTDVVMPELGGRELAELLRRERPDLPVLFMSGYTDDDIFRRGILPADAAFLEKPFSSHSLTSAVRSVLEPASV